MIMRFLRKHRGQVARSGLSALLVLAPAAAIFTPLHASATVPTSSNSVTVPGNGAQISFTFPFVGVAPSDIQVLFTDASGNQTTLTQGPGPTQYTVTLNPVVPPALWGVGGTVTYNPSGTPIASGTTLTITRTLPLQQNTSLQNQASFGQYATVTEQALDLQNMQLQQLGNTIGRTIVANPANSSPPNPLPPAAQVANQGVCFDGTGNNLIGCVLPSSGVISSAMAPVVSAASIPAGRTALGLGSMALEAINGGTCGGATIQDDGAGNARVVFATVSDSSNQAVTCAFHGQQHMATGALVYTLPRANTLFGGFGFWVYALNSSVTFAVNAADGFSGAASGASMTIPAGSQAYVSTNAQASGTWFLNLTNLPSLNAPLNLNLSASVNANALTISVLDRNGNVPSTASPVIFPVSLNGNLVPRAITGSLTITVPNTATIGTVSGQAGRLWVGVFDNSGTPVLGVYNSLNASAPSIKSWDETSAATGTAIAAASNNSQTWYTSGSVTAAFRVLGYVEFTEPTAGTWSVAPSKVQLFGPGVKRPGEVVQEVTELIASSDTTSSATFVALANNRISITPVSSSNLIRVESAAGLDIGYGANSVTANLQLSRGTVNAAGLIGNQSLIAASTTVSAAFSVGCSAYTVAYDLPQAAATYALQGKVNSGTASFTIGGNSFMSAREIQI